MFRNDDPTAVTSAPTDTAPTGSTPGFFSDGNPGSGQPATIVPDWWLNQVQEELLSFLTAAGIGPAKGVNNQILSSAQKLFGSGGYGATNGWQRVAGGIILQWGQATTVTGRNDQIFFPMAFPNNLFSIVACEANAVAAFTGNPSLPQPSIYGTTRSSTPLVSFLIAAAYVGNSGPIYAVDTVFNYIAIGN